ncbi:hypothetical protein J437_LFUL018931 [Ladona fulva]|uniref:Uncharacterized protein n=1 Tax=Ladona fulva TaxID=123851 RepID=A0A8K0KS01_LADFU|nr:hypothetical protein J437_LFUL018931 [Ladona fulva]
MAVRLWKDRVRQARRRAMESDVERERRLAQDRERTRARRAKESPEEKARRLERARVYMAEKRRRLVAMVAMENGIYDN